MKNTRLFAAMVLLSTALSVHASWLAGVGSATCGQFLANSTSKLWTESVTNWAMGFLSAVNLERGKTKGERVLKDIPDPDAVRFYIENYCRANPLSTVSHGADALYDELPAFRRENK